MTLHLDHLASPDYWRSLADDGVLRLTFVVPTGRAAECPNINLALSSDALYFADLALAIKDHASAAGLKLEVRSLFDIDAFEDVESAHDPMLDNLIVTGSANVSVVARHLLDRSMSWDTYGAGFVKPYDDHPKIGSIRDTSARNAKYNSFTSPKIGMLAMYENPFGRPENRIALLCAGLLAVGTIASVKLLLSYVRGEVHGNNQYAADVPVKIVKAVEREYKNTTLKHYEDCIPTMDVRNIKGFEVLE